MSKEKHLYNQVLKCKYALYLSPFATNLNTILFRLIDLYLFLSSDTLQMLIMDVVILVLLIIFYKVCTFP